MSQLLAFSYEVATDARKLLVNTPTQFEQMVRQLRDHKIRIFDHETTGLAWMQHARSCGLALGVFEGETIQAWYVPYRHTTGEQQLDFGVISPTIRQLFAEPDVLWVGHNIKFDDHMNRREGWFIAGRRYCTQMAARLYDENKPLALKKRAYLDLGISSADLWEDFLDAEVKRLVKHRRMGVKAYKDRYGYSEMSITLCGRYACFDIDYTGQLYRFYENFGVSRRYARIWATEMELNEALTDMEELGTPIDVEYLEDLRSRLEMVERTLGEQIGIHLNDSAFNPASDAHVKTFLYDRLTLPVFKWTDHDQPSVDHEVLEHYQHSHPVMKSLMTYRLANKIRTTWTDSLLAKLDDKGVLHGTLRPDGTNSGRLSSSDPNLQNFKTDDSKRAEENSGVDPWSVRRAFVMRREAGGLVIPRLYFDYSQIELRTVAKYTMEPNMVSAFCEGKDIHAKTQEEISLVAGKEPPRRVAKIINFGLIYCMSAGGLARNAKIPKKEADFFMEAFFERYSGIVDARLSFWEKARSNHNGFVNMWGRKRIIPDLSSSDHRKRSRAQRQLFGCWIQGTAAELTKESIVRVYRWLKKTGSAARLVSTVHDEIWLDCPASELLMVVPAVKKMMETYPEFDPIPVVVSGEYSVESWQKKLPLPG